MTAFGYELRRVKSLVAAHRDAAVARNLLQHHQRRIALGAPVGFQQLRVHDQPVAILYLQIAAVAQLGLLAWSLARQLRIRIGLRLMGFVGPLLAMKIHRRVTGIIGRCGRLLFLRLKALQARPGFQQRAVHREVLVGNQTRFPRPLHHLRQKLLGHRRLQQAVAVLGKRGRIPHLLVQVQPHKPADTGCCSRSPPSAAARYAPNRASATTAPAKASPAESTAGRLRHTWRRTTATSTPESRPSWPAPHAEDGPSAPAAPATSN